MPPFIFVRFAFHRPVEHLRITRPGANGNPGAGKQLLIEHSSDRRLTAVTFVGVHAVQSGTTG